MPAVGIPINFLQPHQALISYQTGQWVLIKAKNFKVVMDEMSNLGIYYSCPAGKTSPGVRTLQGKEALKVV